MHTAAADPATGRIWVFGGIDSTGMHLNDLHYFDTQAMRWSGPVTAAQGTPPAARAEHTAAVHNGSLFIFGGRHRATPLNGGVERSLNDLHRLDLQTMTWHQIACSSSSSSSALLSPRHSAASVVVPALTALLVLGGIDSSGRALRDAWAFDLRPQSSAVWTELAAPLSQQLYSTAPAPRHSHTAAVSTDGTQVIVIGGLRGASAADLTAAPHAESLQLSSGSNSASSSSLSAFPQGHWVQSSLARPNACLRSSSDTVSAAAVTAARHSAAAATDAATGLLYEFGGYITSAAGVEQLGDASLRVYRLALEQSGSTLCPHMIQEVV
jgi:Kelch motif/Galactose oxidase, central domain